MKTDILIIGGGLSGICAAYEILKNSDRRVDLLQWGGGASPYIHGFCLPVGEGDSEALLFSDSIASGCGQSRESLVRRLCRDSLSLSDYFRELGLQVDEEYGKPRLVKSLGSSAPRIAGIGNNTGPVMLSTLKKQLIASGRYREHKNFRALALIKNGEQVVGVRCYDKDTDTFRSISAGVVILASGGFGRLFPESTNASDIGGDGCAMAYLAGGKMTDMEFIQFEPSAAVWPDALAGKSIITTMFYEGAVLRNGSGDRFMLRLFPEGERVPKDVQAKAISRQIRQGNHTPHGGVWFDATAVPETMWDGIYKPYRNRYLTHGIDIAKQPVEVAPAAHTTCGGVLIDEACRTGVPGLIACGEVTGGLHGANRLGGNAGLETMVFGRIAGRTAQQERSAQPELDENICPNRPGDPSVNDLRRELQQLLRQALGVIRNGAELQSGIDRVDRMLLELGAYEGCYEKHRLYNDLLTARMALLAASHRKGSVGCHYREDSADEPAYRITIVKQAETMMLLHDEI